MPPLPLRAAETPCSNPQAPSHLSGDLSVSALTHNTPGDRASGLPRRVPTGLMDALWPYGVLWGLLLLVPTVLLAALCARCRDPHGHGAQIDNYEYKPPPCEPHNSFMLLTRPRCPSRTPIKQQPVTSAELFLSIPRSPQAPQSRKVSFTHPEPDNACPATRTRVRRAAIPGVPGRGPRPLPPRRPPRVRTTTTTSSTPPATSRCSRMARPSPTRPSNPRPGTAAPPRRPASTRTSPTPTASPWLTAWSTSTSLRLGPAPRPATPARARRMPQTTRTCNTEHQALLAVAPR
ncbi:uncharacterized protein DKFZp434B061-like isoform X1 [Apteryx mantelli]|uniref:Uncharacterized protein DKFZp434B061-like isoform X1 n=1 Tax=Apteryx mantelli TaxID=2696672 RepID=A0ABM4G1G8_9AVES